MSKSFSKIRHIQESNLKLEKRFLNESKEPINEGVLMTLGGIALGAGIIKKAYDYISNKILENRMEETGKIKKGSNGVIMKEYIDKKNDEVYWGIDVTDKVTAEPGLQKRHVLLFKDDPKRIERILNSEIRWDATPENIEYGDWDRSFGQFVSDKKIFKGFS
jgi:hypothetical protein